jgi:hypothetical protein
MTVAKGLFHFHLRRATGWASREGASGPVEVYPVLSIHPAAKKTGGVFCTPPVPHNIPSKSLTDFERVD